MQAASAGSQVELGHDLASGRLRLLGTFPVKIKAVRIGGVQVEDFTPFSGGDQTCVLINLHGGAFYSGATHIARVESIPIAHLGGFRVVSVDYRQGYKHKYPAATEDVVAVYTELLKSYPSERIGIYGGSAGGALTLQTTASLIEHGAPRPGVIAVLGSGGAAGGTATISPPSARPRHLR